MQYVFWVVGGLFALWILFMDRRRAEKLEERRNKYGRNRPPVMLLLWWLVCWSVRFAFGLCIYGLLLGMPAMFFYNFLPIADLSQREEVSPQDLRVNEIKGRIQLTEGDFTLDGRTITPAAKTRILKQLGGNTKFGHSTWKALADYGRELQGGGATLPFRRSQESVSEEEYAAFALLRLSGQDHLFNKKMERFFATVEQTPKMKYASEGMTPSSIARDYQIYAMMMHIFYPNDDLAFLAFGEGWVATSETRQEESWIKKHFFSASLGFLLLALLVQRGTRLLTVSLLGRVLFIKNNEHFTFYREAVFNPYRFLISTVSVIVLSYFLTKYYLEPFFILYFQSKEALIMALIWNALMGGVLVESLSNVMTLLVIRKGGNPLATWWDNILTAVLAVLLLYYFQNSWISIVSGILLGLTTSLIYKIMGRRAYVSP